MQVAFSEFWGFLGGVLCAVEGVCNLAVFPTVTLDYLLELSGLRCAARAARFVSPCAHRPLAPAHPTPGGSDDSPLLSWTLKAGMCVALALLNVRGIDWVGSSVAVLSVVVTAPLVVFCILGLFHLQVGGRGDAPGISAHAFGGRGRGSHQIGPGLATDGRRRWRLRGWPAAATDPAGGLG